jgi:hypothetical protein
MEWEWAWAGPQAQVQDNKRNGSNFKCSSKFRLTVEWILHGIRLIHKLHEIRLSIICTFPFLRPACLPCDSEGHLPALLKQIPVPPKFVVSPQNLRQLTQKAEEEAWKLSSNAVRPFFHDGC